MSVKYDASMTQYHSNIATAIKRMCRHDKTAMKLVKDASPAPLREHLKKSYKYNGAGDASSFYQGSPKDMKIEFNGESIILSWSQVAKFIRDNPSEIFDDYNALPNQPVCECNTENNKTYLEVFREHYPNADEKQLFGDYCPAGFFKNGIDDDSSECSGPDRCDECWNRTANSEWFENRDYHYYVPDKWKKAECINEPSDEELEQDRAALKKAISEVNENHIDCPYYKKDAALNYIGYGAVHFECQKHEEEFSDPYKLKVFINNHCYNSVWCNYCQEQEPQDTPAELPAAQSSSDTSVFDYSELDSDTTKALKGFEAIIKQETSGYFTMLGSKFKEAQELLAKHGKGTFERWYSSIGFKRQTVYNLIQRYEFSSSPTIGGHEEIFEALPVTLSYEISKPTAPPELVDKVLSGDITSNSEYKKELDQIQEEARKAKERAEEAEKKAAFWSKTSAETSKENQQLRAERVTEMNRADNAERKNSELEHRVKELESRPVDVAVQTDDSLLKEKDQEISELKEQIERMSDKNVKSFVIRMSLDEYELLEKALEQADDRLKNIIKNARILKI